jgi:ABC-type uncharacterized transport system permease subunit
MHPGADAGKEAGDLIECQVPLALKIGPAPDQQAIVHFQAAMAPCWAKVQTLPVRWLWRRTMAAVTADGATA